MDKEINKFKEIKLSGSTIFSGKILTLEKDEVLCPSGRKSTREVIRHCNSVCIIAQVDDKIIFERQYRYPYDEVIWELPAGKVDKGEDLDKAVIRELEEESGYLAKTVTYLGKIYPSCAYTDELIHLYYTNDLIQANRHLDPNEVIDIYYLTLEEINEMVIKNEIKDAKTLCALQMFYARKKA